VDTPEWSWRGPGPLALFWSVLPLAILAPAPLLLLSTPLGGFEQLDPAVATLGIALSTNLATTLVVALTVVGTGAASWRAIFGQHRVSSPNLPVADRRGGALGDVAWGLALTAFAHTLNIGGESIADALAVAFVAFAIRLPLGLALGWLWVRRQSLLATITLHAAYNALLVFAAFSV